MRIQKVVTAIVLLALLAGAMEAQTAPQPSALVERRASRLQRGINTSHWFAQVYDKAGYTRAHFESHTTAADIALIKSAGFDHVRLSVEPAPLFNRSSPKSLPAEYLSMLDGAVQMILKQDLAVILDIHPATDFKRQLESDDGAVEAFTDFWEALAAHYASLDPERIFFEVLNEPEFRDTFRWQGVQARVAAGIRRGAPQHTMIAAGARWSSLDELIAMQPLADGNVIYNFHFYEPHIFTHQGATWGVLHWAYLSQLPYPATPGGVEKNMHAVASPVSRLEVMRYGLSHWNAQRVEAEIAQAAAWARAHGVKLTCNEFGVYRKFARPEERAAWLRDVRTAFEKHGIGWTMWDYAGGFAVAPRESGKSELDQVTLRALGLRAP